MGQSLQSEFENVQFITSHMVSMKMEKSRRRKIHGICSTTTKKFPSLAPRSEVTISLLLLFSVRHYCNEALWVAEINSFQNKDIFSLPIVPHCSIVPHGKEEKKRNGDFWTRGKFFKNVTKTCLKLTTYTINLRAVDQSTIQFQIFWTKVIVHPVLGLCVFLVLEKIRKNLWL